MVNNWRSLLSGGVSVCLFIFKCRKSAISRRDILSEVVTTEVSVEGRDVPEGLPWFPCVGGGIVAEPANEELNGFELLEIATVAKDRLNDVLIAVEETKMRGGDGGSNER